MTDVKPGSPNARSFNSLQALVRSVKYFLPGQRLGAERSSGYDLRLLGDGRRKSEHLAASHTSTFVSISQLLQLRAWFSVYKIEMV